MTDRNTFLETLKEVSEIVRTSGEPLKREEILLYFRDMELTPEQEELVIKYLSENHDDMPDTVMEQEETEIQETTSEKSAVFRMYMNDIEALGCSGDEEIRAEYVKLLTGDENAVRIIASAWLKRIVDMAEKLLRGTDNLEDVIQEGNLALFIRLKELCGSRLPADVEKELEEAVSVAMKDYISVITGEEDGEEIIAGKVNLVNEAVKYLTEQNGYTPSEAELAGYTHMETDELREITDIIKKSGERN